MTRVLLCLLMWAASLYANDLIPSPSLTPTVAASADAAKYGEFPKNYMTIVNDWLAMQLLDPKSAVVEFTSTPQPSELPSGNGGQLFGYLVEFKVNSRNRFGAYTGFQKHGALIRDGQVVRATGFGY
jgi:hypothetical protein